jgi:hypothetical protein
MRRPSDGESNNAIGAVSFRALVMVEVVAPIWVPPIAVSAMTALDTSEGASIGGPCGGGEGVGSGWRAWRRSRCRCTGRDEGRP